MTLDIDDILRKLLAEAEQIEFAIASLRNLRNLRNGSMPAKRRGRRSMGAKERQEVSERMKRYWAARRKGK